MSPQDFSVDADEVEVSISEGVSRSGEEMEGEGGCDLEEGRMRSPSDEDDDESYTL